MTGLPATIDGEARSRPRVLVLNASGRIEGDINTVLMLLRHSRGELDYLVVSQPGGAVHSALSEVPGIELRAMQMGGERDFQTRRRGGPLRHLIAALQAAAAIVRLCWLVRRERVECVYTIDRGVAPKLAVAVSKLTGCPFVLCAAYPFYAGNGPSCRYVLRHVTKLHVHSEYLRYYLAPYVLNPGKFVIIPNGIDVDQFNPENRGVEVRRSHGLSSDDHVVAMTGRLNEFKGQDDLIVAAQDVLDGYPNTYFLIAGRGDFEETLKAMIERMCLDEHVRLVGYVESLESFIGAADIMVMPSREEPFGLVALEALAMAKPLVATRAGGVPEFVIDGEVGVLVAPQDPSGLAAAIISLLKDRDRAAALGAKGRQHVERSYSAQLYAKRVVDLLAAVARPTGR